MSDTGTVRSAPQHDPLLDVDWVDHWRRLVRRRAARFGAHEWTHFDRIARNYATSVANQPDMLLTVIEPFLDSTTTLIDVGAGSGRHVVPLAPRLKHVVAVEPSSGMRDLIPTMGNVTVIPSDWLGAEVLPAEMVLSSHVLYAIDEPVPFIRKMEAVATEHVFIYLRDSQPVHPSVALAEVLTGEPMPRMPQLRDLYLILRQIGVAPDVVLRPNHWVQRYQDLDAAVAACRERLRDSWDDGRGRAWLAEHLVRAPNGSLTFTDPASMVEVIHWTPRLGETDDRA